MIAKKFLKSKSICKSTCTLPTEAAATAKEVVLVGDFNNWDAEAGITMKKQKDVFKTTVELEMGKEYEFRYLLDGEVWENDWAADKYVATPFGVDNSVVSTLN